MSRRAWSSIAAEAVIWSALAASMLLVAQQCAGCTSALRTHATAATIAGHTITAAGETVMDARRSELDACADAACLDAGEARWSPWVASLRLAAEAWSAWEAAIVAGFAAPDEDDALPLALDAARHLVALWDALADVLESAGVTVPRLPGEVIALLGGGS